MKKQIFFKLISAILALSVLSSCIYKNSDLVSSDASKSESRNNSEIEFLNNQFESNFEVKRFDDLSKEKEDEISACVKKDGYEYQSEQYFGTYNEYDIVLISQIDGVEYRDAQLKKIAEYGYRIGDTEKLIAYKDNSYMLLSRAYSKGIITKPDMKNAMYLYEEYYFANARDRVRIVVKKNDNNPDKKYTADDFPTIKIKEVLHERWLPNELGENLVIVFPIKNTRNVLNIARELGKMDNVLSVELYKLTSFPFSTSLN